MQGFDPHKAHIEVAHPYLTMMGLYLGGFTGMFSETSLNIALPQLTEAFGVDVAVMQWMVVGYMLVIGIVLPFASLLMKWFSVRKLTLFALSAFFVGSLISGFAPRFEVMLAGRLVQGVGTGLVLPMMFAVVLEVFAPVKIGAAMGLTALIIMFAPAIGPTLSGIILGVLSWRFIFFTFAAVLAVAMAFAAKFLVNPYELTRPRVDALSLRAVVPGIRRRGAGAAGVVMPARMDPGVRGGIRAGHRRGLHCRLRVSPASHGDPRAGCARVLPAGLSRGRGAGDAELRHHGLIRAHVPAAAVHPKRHAAACGHGKKTGMLMLPGGVVNCIVSVIAGGLYDRIGARIPARAGFALSIVGTVMFLFATPDSSIAYVICAHVILMIGVPLAMSPSQTRALNSLPHRMNADGSTMMNTLQQVLGAIATAVATSLLGMGQAASAESGAVAFTNGVHWGFAFTLVLAVAALAVSMLLKKRSYADEAGAPEGCAAPARTPRAECASANPAE